MIVLLSILFAMESKSCSVTHYCANGTTISCTADGSAAHCDNGPNYVRCEYYDEAGNKQIIQKTCGIVDEGEEQ